METKKYDAQPSKEELLSKLFIVTQKIKEAIEKDQPFMLNGIIDDGSQGQCKIVGMGDKVSHRLAGEFLLIQAKKLNQLAGMGSDD